MSPADNENRMLELWRTCDPETRRVIEFVAVAIDEGVWPEAEFLAAPESRTTAESVELFHRTIRSIPQAKREAVWRRVDALRLSARPRPNA